MKKYRLTYAFDRDNIFAEEFVAENLASALELVRDVMFAFFVTPTELTHFANHIQEGTKMVGIGIVEVSNS